MANVFFISVRKKIIKHFGKKSFIVFGGAHERPLNTLKLGLAKCFIIFFHAYEKYICHHITSFFYKKLLVLSSNMIFQYNTF